MGKHKKNSYEFDDEFIAQMDFLRAGYDDAVKMLEEQKADIHKPLAIMIENDVPVPQNIAKKYIRITTEEELPFN